jgi:hypothetical protein
MDEQESKAALETHSEPSDPVLPPERPAVTFLGNSIDLASLGAMVLGLLSLFMCMSCNMGFYCLPFIPIILGLVGLVSAGQAVDVERTRLWSWIGLGSGLFFLVLFAAALIFYIALLIIVFSTGEQTYWQSLSMLLFV